jgi:hypothetical protein
MKKTILSAVLASLAMSSYGLGFSWQSSAAVSFGESLVSGLTPNTYTAYLVYLGSDAAWGNTTITSSGIQLDTGDLATGDTSTSIAGKTGLQAKKNSTFVEEFSGLIGSTTSGGWTVKAGDTLGVFLKYTDADGKDWFNVSADTFTIDSAATDITTGLSGTFAFSSSKTSITEGGKATAGGGWVAVPEPSTAALALAGLALLLKRRKA